MPTLTAYGIIKDGRLTLANRKRFEADLLSFKDCTVELSVRKKNRRSTPQNKWYWGVVVKEIEIRLKELGNDFDSDTVHEFLKDKFNKKEVIGEGGEVLDYIGGSTTEMNKEDFLLYADKIVQWAAETLCIAIPLPNTDLQLNF